MATEKPEWWSCLPDGVVEDDEWEILDKAMKSLAGKWFESEIQVKPGDLKDNEKACAAIDKALREVLGKMAKAKIEHPLEKLKWCFWCVWDSLDAEEPKNWRFIALAQRVYETATLLSEYRRYHVLVKDKGMDKDAEITPNPSPFEMWFGVRTYGDAMEVYARELRQRNIF